MPLNQAEIHKATTPLLNLAHARTRQAALRIRPLAQTPFGAQPGGVLCCELEVVAWLYSLMIERDLFGTERLVRN